MNHSGLAFLTNPHSTMFWIIWAVMLLWQNYAFTEVSRARSSGSLARHAKAALMSNGVWFMQTIFATSAFMKIITGEYGLKLGLFAVLYYTAFTMTGSIYAHYRALKKEKGSSAVGANKKYAQIPVSEWASVLDEMKSHFIRLGEAETRLAAAESRLDTTIRLEDWERIKREFGELQMQLRGEEFGMLNRNAPHIAPPQIIGEPPIQNPSAWPRDITGALHRGPGMGGDSL